MAFYGDFTHPTSLLKVACLCLQAAMGDGVIVWRLYIVYDRRILVAIPAILLVTAYTAMACVIVVMMANSKPGADIPSVASHYITAHLALSMLSNVLFSGTLYSPMVFLFQGICWVFTRDQGRLHGEFSPLEDPFE